MWKEVIVPKYAWYTKQLNTRITVGMKEKLEEAADELGQSQAEAVRTALVSYIRMAGVEVELRDT